MNHYSAERKEAILKKLLPPHNRTDVGALAARLLSQVWHRHEPIEYRIETRRQGRSFASRHVTATQNENVVFSMSMSFVTRDEDEYFQAEMPKVKLAEERHADRVAAGIETPGGPPAAGGRIEMENISNLFKTNDELGEGEERDMDISMWRRFPYENTTTERQNQIIVAFMSDGPLPFCSVALTGCNFFCNC
jgi:acyl-CoA thioesterase II